MTTVLKATSVAKRYRTLNRGGPSTLKEAMLTTLRGERKERDDHWALRDVTFSVERGRSLGIIGHNGAGKSTLLRLLCGVGQPTLGHIERSGPVHGLLSLGNGFQPDLSGAENVLTGGILSGFTMREVRERVADIVHFAELEDYIDQPVRTYSSGMYLRLAFSTAMHFDPELLIVDEILAVGDTRFQQKCIDRLRTFRAGGGTLVLTSHALDQIQSLCEQVLVLEEGRVVMCGDPDDALSCYAELMRERTQRRREQVGLGDALPAPKIGKRQGTQEATITALNLCNGDGRPLETLGSGEELTVELAYELRAPISDMAITVGIYRDQRKCFEATVPSAAAAFGPLVERGIVRCRLPAVALVPGPYFVNVGLYPPDWAFIYDYHWQMHPIGVTAVDLVTQHVSGVVAVRPEWSCAQVS